MANIENTSAPNLQNFDWLRSINAEYIDEIYTKYMENPDSIDSSWKFFFDGIYLGEATALAEAQVTHTQSAGDWVEELKVFHLIQAYKNYGHLLARINPLQPAPEQTPELMLSRYFLTEASLNQVFQVARFLGLEPTSLRGILDYLKKAYSNTVGIELLQIQDPEQREWLENQIESLQGQYRVSPENQKFILKRLSDSEALEKFIHTRYVAQKRFSIEGGEALIPALDCAIETATSLGAREIVVGMAHRGRLNVMVNIFGKKPEAVFTEFDDNYRLSTDHGEGDVKYHKGHSLDFVTRQGNPVHLSLGFNPSHLEFINPVAMGVVKAKQLQRNDTDKTKVLFISIHGDAAFSGQGVVYETLQASQIEGYNVGGTLHIISNNQVGFTTDPTDSRSTRYCTDLGRMLDAPIFHVNGDDPEAVWHTLRIATEFRYRFKKDVLVDLICYRKYGHNEGDEPSFTQPLLYKTISGHSSPRDLYGKKLIAEGLLSEDEAGTLFQSPMDEMGKALEKVRAQKPEPFISEYEGKYWSKYHSANSEEIVQEVDTSVSPSSLLEISKQINRFPQGFTLHPKLGRLFEGRLQAIEQGTGIDWGNAEVLAYATLVKEGHPVRMTGQDVRRGTFTHRHAAVVDFTTNQSHIAINDLHATSKLHIYNSFLSETAVMGFEFGWSIADPDSLTIWEGQFGDFANGAQVIIDQFIATSESKWHRASGLTLLLPHGFEGQGPEHSSARLERFLQLCGRNNMIVCHPTTPAQIFHLLRRQVIRPFRKPLVVMTPKSLLRHPKAVSQIHEFTKDSFHKVLDDALYPDPRTAAGVKRILVCTGKVYYDLLKEKENRTTAKTALIRLEQLYPWPEQELALILEKYSAATEIYFVQEEPRNMGAWTYFHGMWSGALAEFGARFPALKLKYVGRDICASPAVGSKKLHDKEQNELILKAFQE